LFEFAEIHSTTPKDLNTLRVVYSQVVQSIPQGFFAFALYWVIHLQLVDSEQIKVVTAYTLIKQFQGIPEVQLVTNVSKDLVWSFQLVDKRASKFVTAAGVLVLKTESQVTAVW
jgi:hypothetical protein